MDISDDGVYQTKLEINPKILEGRGTSFHQRRHSQSRKLSASPSPGKSFRVPVNGGWVGGDYLEVLEKRERMDEVENA